MFAAFGFQVRIQLAQFFGMDKVKFLGQARLDLRIHLIYHIFGAHHGCIDTGYYLLEEFHIAVFGGNDAFPVPLVYIKGMQIAQFFIGTDGIHVCVDAISRFDMVFGKREAFPFGEGVHHFSFGVAQIFDRESHGTFHSIEVVIDTHSFQYEQWSCHTSQAQFGREVQLEELFNLFNP